MFSFLFLTTFLILIISLKACDRENKNPDTNCTTCLGNWDIESDCIWCLSNWKLESGCTECENMWSLKYDCKLCPHNYDKKTGCVNCSNHWEGENCSICPDGYYENQNCQKIDTITTMITISIASGIVALISITILYIFLSAMICGCVKNPMRKKRNKNSRWNFNDEYDVFEEDKNLNGKYNKIADEDEESHDNVLDRLELVEEEEGESENFDKELEKYKIIGKKRENSENGKDKLEEEENVENQV